jgi:hypothetical protein
VTPFVDTLITHPEATQATQTMTLRWLATIPSSTTAPLTAARQEESHGSSQASSTEEAASGLPLL